MRYEAWLGVNGCLSTRYCRATALAAQYARDDEAVKVQLHTASSKRVPRTCSYVTADTLWQVGLCKSKIHEVRLPLCTCPECEMDNFIVPPLSTQVLDLQRLCREGAYAHQAQPCSDFLVRSQPPLPFSACCLSAPWRDLHISTPPGMEQMHAVSVGTSTSMVWGFAWGTICSGSQ